jgi:hypothetical protein
MPPDNRLEGAVRGGSVAAGAGSYCARAVPTGGIVRPLNFIVRRQEEKP